MELDPFVQKQPGHVYPVRSLYFDDDRYSAFQDKIDGMHTRSKFRLRTYSTDLDKPAPWFLETKGRYNNLVFKHRTPVGTNGLDLTISGPELCAEIMARSEGPVRDRFVFDYFRRGIRQVALIDYLRRPYISKFDPEFRLTIDQQLSAVDTDALYYDPSLTASPRRIVPGYSVIEVKFRRHIPSWFHRIIQAYELNRQSISKICKGMQVLELAVDPG